MYINKVLQHWSQESGHHFVGNAVLFQGDVPMSVSLVPGNNKNYYVIAAVDASRLEKPEIKAITKRLKPYGVLMIGKRKNFLQLTVSAISRKRLYKKLDNAVLEIGQLVHEYSIPVQAECAYCGEVGCDAVAFVNNAVPVHTACHRNNVEEQIEQVENNRKHGNYLPATLAALVGALIGAVPSLISMVAADYIIAFLFILIPLASAFVYKRVDGVQNWFMPFVVSIMSLAASIALVLADLYFDIGIGTPLATFFSTISHRRYRADVLLLFGQVLFFGGIGILCAWSFMAKTGKQQLKELQAMRDNILPIVKKSEEKNEEEIRPENEKALEELQQ